MLRTVNAQPTLWEAILPEACLGLPAELVAVDRLLDDPVFFEPFRAHFHATSSVSCTIGPSATTSPTRSPSNV